MWCIEYLEDSNGLGSVFLDETQLKMFDERTLEDVFVCLCACIRQLIDAYSVEARGTHEHRNFWLASVQVMSCESRSSLAHLLIGLGIWIIHAILKIPFSVLFY